MPTYRVRTSTVYLLSEGATSVLVPISFLLKGCDIVIIISCHTAHSSRSMRWKPLLFPYSHLILCSHYLMAWDLPYYSHTEYRCCYFKVGLTVKTESRHYQSRLVFFSFALVSTKRIGLLSRVSAWFPHST